MCPQKEPKHFGKVGDTHQKISSMLNSMYNTSTKNFEEGKNIEWRLLQNPLLTAEWINMNKWMKWNRLGLSLKGWKVLRETVMGKLLKTWAKEEKWYYMRSFPRTTSRPISLQRKFPQGCGHLWLGRVPPRECTWAAKVVNHKVGDSGSKVWTGVGWAFTYIDVELSTAGTEWGCISAWESWWAVFFIDRWGMNLPSPTFSSPSKVLGPIIATQRMKKSFSSYRIS